MCIVHACTEKARNTKTIYEKWNLCSIRARRVDRMYVVVTMLCNQPETFALDLGDDQSRYLLINDIHTLMCLSVAVFVVLLFVLGVTSVSSSHCVLSAMMKCHSDEAFASPLLDNIRVMVIVWRLRLKREYYQNCSVLDCMTQCSQSAETYMSSSYRSNRLGLSHWDPYTVHRGSCLELYYCKMLEWFWWYSSLILTTNWFPSVL